MKAKLTPRYLDALAVTPGQRLEVFDTVAPGLALRVGEQSKAWIVLYRAHGRMRRQTLGRYPLLSLADAREQARDVQREAAKGLDPVSEARTAKARTFEALALDYIERHAKPRKKSWPNAQRILDKHLLPHWRTHPATAITRADVRDRLDAIAATAPVQANRVRALCSKVFAFALGRDWVTANPVTGLLALVREKSRTRVLTTDEIGTFWRALDTHEAAGRLDGAQADQLRLRLLLGQRAGEVAGMQWKDVADGPWTQPDPKNRRTHLLPAPDPLKAILARQRVPCATTSVA